MNLFGLDSASILTRARAAPEPPRILTLAECVIQGGLTFSLVSGLVFATVAFGERWLYQHFSISGSYAFWAVLFVLAGGGALGRLVIGPGGWLRFSLAFGLAFMVYAAAWTGAYFILKGRWGESVGAVAGTILMALVFCVAFSAFRAFGKVAIALLAGNLAGHFLGRLVWTAMGGKAGMIAWGFIYGLGFGLALGYTIYVCQQRARAALAEQRAQA